MKNYITIFLALLIFSCSSKKETVKQENLNVETKEQKVEQPTTNQITTYKENNTLISGLVDTLEIIDDYNFRIITKVITAIPDDWNVSIIEPEQTITIYPAYIIGQNNTIDLQNPINAKIYELRNLKKKGFLIGKVTLAKDNKFYITQVEAWQNQEE